MKKALALSLLVGIICMALAGNAVAGVFERIAEQQKRIDNGIIKGSLTKKEAAILQDNLNYIRGKAAKMKAGGGLSPSEVDYLQKMLDDNDAQIYEGKHNSKVRKLY